MMSLSNHEERALIVIPGVREFPSRAGRESSSFNPRHALNPDCRPRIARRTGDARWE
jgi:hypothetical protein